jgi:hypothetical protein
MVSSYVSQLDLYILSSLTLSLSRFIKTKSSEKTDLGRRQEIRESGESEREREGDR